MQQVDSVAPADTREQTYELLSERAPARVVVDTELSDHVWYVVRAPNPQERRRLFKAHGEIPDGAAAAAALAPTERKSK